MNTIHVLILSAGRRVELVNCFRSAAKELGIKSNILAADCSKTAPALYFADKHVIVPRIDSGNYIEAIIAVCKEEKVALIVPTIDTELLLLSEHKELIESSTGAKLLVSDPAVIGICRNKAATQTFMEENSFLMPRLFTEEELAEGKLPFPLFIKPIDGSSSINAFKVHNQEELDIYRKLIEKPLVQEYIEGEEYTVDVFLDFDATLITVVPRLRIATRSGEILKGRIVRDREIIADVTRLMKLLKPIGHITVQCKKTDRGIAYIEINPRFGGGAPMSIKAGADSCKNLYRLLNNEKLVYNEDYRENITFLRFDSCIMLNGNMEPENEKSRNF
ncbi:MAG TPA: ATP-grasp domain-containing protein [Lachnospiraceae bacterium]|nr:ATP-grasp domain-containing protein [Lachnospiraceae bacterium]